MVISLKKLFCIFILIVCALAFAISTCSAYSSLTTIAKANENDKLVTVVIDAGHGGEDGGAVAADDTVEKDINLSIALKLKSLLLQNGVKVVMTREEDIAIYDENCTSLKEKKSSDMKNRLAIFNGDPQNIVISIHQNKFEQKKYSGTQIFYSTNKPESERLAESIRGSVVSNIQPDNERECKPADKNIYLLYNAQVPAVIVECGFISNDSELALLKDDTYQSKIAVAIFDGFMKYYNNNIQDVK